MSKIAVLGLGAMGSRMARNLLKAGHEVTVYNRSPERAEMLESEGARRAETPREAAEVSEVVICMVAEDESSQAVWLDEQTGAAHGLGEGAIAVESSTLTPDWVQELAGKIRGRGAGFLDAPVVGSRPQAEAGQLIYLVGGETRTFERARPVLEVMGGAIHHVGTAGQGAALKLAVNALFGVQVAAIGELLGMIRKLGVEEGKAVEILGQTPVMSPAAKGVAGLMQTRNFAPTFPIDLVEKDFRYVVEAASGVDAKTPTSAAVRDVYALAKEAGYGEDNIAGVAQLFD